MAASALIATVLLLVWLVQKNGVRSVSPVTAAASFAASLPLPFILTAVLVEYAGVSEVFAGLLGFLALIVCLAVLIQHTLHVHSFARAFTTSLAFWLLFFSMQAVLIAGTKLFLFEWYFVDGEAMEPNVPSGQVIFAEALSDAYEHGDVIVYKYPADPSRIFIHRVAAVPGDTVSLVKGELYINNEKVWHQYQYNTKKAKENLPPVELGEGEYYVLGDNLDRSSDSRSWGVLQEDLIVGKQIKMAWE